MNTKEQQFTNIIKEHERTIYTVCYMFSEDTDEVNDLYQDMDLSRQSELLHQLQQPAEEAARTAEPRQKFPHGWKQP